MVYICYQLDYDEKTYNFLTKECDCQKKIELYLEGLNYKILHLDHFFDLENLYIINCDEFINLDKELFLKKLKEDSLDSILF